MARSASARRAAALLLAGFCLVSACGSKLSSAPTSTLTGPAALGRQLAGQYFCTDCHSTDGSKRAGPTWKGLSSSTVTLQDGRQVVADADYLRRAITDPQAEAAKGATTSMPRYNFSAEQVDALVAYIQTLG